jgi:uncharacterized protein YjaZ
MHILLLDSADWQRLKNKGITKPQIEKLITAAANEAEAILRDVSPELTIIVKPGLPHITKEMGVGGSTYDAELIDITFDAKLPLGVGELKKYLYQTVFHEMAHALRHKLVQQEDILLSWAIDEGLASVFERDYAGAKRWPKKHDDRKLQRDYQELFAPQHVHDADWFYKNAYVTGIWIVDTALKSSGLDIVELTGKGVDAILKLANLKRL